jgi:hypothetical protein
MSADTQELDATDRLYDEMLNKRLAKLEAALKNIQTIMEPLAGNRKFMQIAGPARQTLNIIKGVL